MSGMSRVKSTSDIIGGKRLLCRGGGDATDPSPPVALLKTQAAQDVPAAIAPFRSSAERITWVSVTCPEIRSSRNPDTGQLILQRRDMHCSVDVRGAKTGGVLVRASRTAGTASLPADMSLWI